MWTGIPFDFSTLDTGVAGMKRYVVEYGLIGVLLVLIYYLSLLKKRVTKMNFGLIVLVLLSLYQNAYPLWWCVLICANLGVQSQFINRNEQKNNCNKSSAIPSI